MRSAATNHPVVVYDGAVTRADLDVWESDLEGLFARMRPLFYRTESRRHAEQYVRGFRPPEEVNPRSHDLGFLFLHNSAKCVEV